MYDDRNQAGGPTYPQYDEPYRSVDRDEGEDVYYNDGITESYRASYLYGGQGDEG